MSNSKALSRSTSTWSVASYGDIAIRFQQGTEEAEQKDCYEEALAICLKSMRSFESIDVNKLTDEQKLELRYHHGQALLRSQFLFDTMLLKNVKFADKLSLAAPAGRAGALPSTGALNVKDQRSSTGLALPSSKTDATDALFSECTTTDDDSDEETRSKNECTSSPSILEGMATSKKGSKRTRMSKEETELRKNIMETVVQQRPTLRLSDVIGLDKAKDALQDAVVVPLAFPESTQAKKAWSGILLYGPSGVGKTRLIKALAGESKMNFMCVDTTAVLSKWQGESTKNVKALFQVARELSPCIMFLDECDALCGGRQNCEGESDKRVKTQFLVEIDGFASSNDKRVVVIGNTNLPGSLDSGFLRRFMRRVYVDLPTETERRQLLEYNLQEYTHDLSKKELSNIVRKTDKFSGHDIQTLVTAAGMIPCREVLRDHGGLGVLLKHAEKVSPDLRNLTKEDFKEALKDVTATNDDKFLADLKIYKEKWENGRSAAYEENEAMNERLKQQSLALKAFSFLLRIFD